MADEKPKKKASKKRAVAKKKPAVRKVAKKRTKQQLHDLITEGLANILLGEKIPLEIKNSETGEIIIPSNRKIKKPRLREIAKAYDKIDISPSPIRNKIFEIIDHYRDELDGFQEVKSSPSKGEVIGTPSSIITHISSLSEEANESLNELKNVFNCPDSANTGLTAISIENFKGISNEITIPIRPLTLLFGANSAGKSTLIHALHYAREIIENKNPDADETLCGGKNLRLGGFRNLVHGHSLNRDVKLHFEITPDFDGIPSLSQTIMGRDEAEYENSEYDRLGYIVGSGPVIVSLTIRWDAKTKRPWVYEYCVKFDPSEEPIARITVEEPNTSAILRFGAFTDELYQMCGENEDSNAAEKIYNTLVNWARKDSTDGYFEIIMSSHYEALPRTDSMLPLPGGPDPSEFDIEGIITHKEVVGLLWKIIVGPLILLKRELAEFRYIGPIRAVPDRDITASKLPDESMWADGKGAYDRLIHDFNHEMGRQGELTDKVSEAFQAQDQLDMGYAFNVVERKLLDDKSDFLGELAKQVSLGEKIDELFFAHNLKSFHNDAPTRMALLLRDTRHGVDVALKDVGVGIAQVFPVVVASLDSEKRFVGIEQPELHLHPDAQYELANLIAKQALKGKTFILELHSEAMILRLLKLVREAAGREAEDSFNDKSIALKPSDLSVIHIGSYEDRPGTIATHVPVNSEGDFDKRWPGGFFRKRLDELPL